LQGAPSAKKVGSLVAFLGAGSVISKTEVSRVCTGIDVHVHAFLNRPLKITGYPFLYLDAI
jgi:putative transposase